MKSADVFLASHDAGGAEILSAWAASHPGIDFRFCLAGPAVAVFERRLGPLAIVPPGGYEQDWDRAVPDLVLTSTSWASDLEKRIREAARARGIRTAAYLDHWANYRERFGHPGPWVERLPDEIWCPDEESHGICLGLGFPPSLLSVKGNPYLEDVVGRIRASGVPEEAGTVLYVCEPIRVHMEKAHGDPLHLGYDEFDAMRHFFAAASRWDPRPGLILIRQHPSEGRGRYDAFLEAYRGDFRIVVSQGTTLLEDIARSSMVVGCESMAMVVALSAGKVVRTSIPPHGHRSRLPFGGILPLG